MKRVELFELLRVFVIFRLKFSDEKETKLFFFFNLKKKNNYYNFVFT